MRLAPLLTMLLTATVTAPAATAADLYADPIPGARIVEPFRAPSGPYAAGHRGVDLTATPGWMVRSPISGVVTFSGAVAGRPVITVQAGNRIFSLEPVKSDLPIGTWVSAGQALGRVGMGGHCSLRCVHLGLRVDGEYRDPLPRRVRLIP